METTSTSEGQRVPFFMMPSLGGGSDLRGFNSWRFRDLHSLLLQAEWRVLVNAFFDTALFYDAGKVTDRRSDLDFSGLKSDYGIGFRIHGPTVTPLRVDIARSNEGFHFVFAASAVF
jgi:outer membrane translocation and assembly module TamA